MTDRTRQIRNNATDKKRGMTLAEVQQFVDDCYRAGMPTDTPVSAVGGFPRSQIQWLRAEAKETLR